MICRKCGAEIPDNSMRCKNCGMKINMYCPKCRTLNRFGEKHCVNCGTELILSCSVCGSSNIYYANDCRKCHSPLIKGSKADVKPPKDIQVVESFSAEESAYAKKDIDCPIRVTGDENKKDLPTLEPNNTGYCETNTDDIFGHDEGFIKPIEDVQKTKDEKVEQQEEILTEQTDEYENFKADETFSSDSELVNQELGILEDLGDDLENLDNDFPIPESLLEELKQGEDTTSKIAPKEFEEVLQLESYIPNIEHDLEENQIDVHPDIVLKITNIIKNSLQKHVIAITGSEGSGKSAILKQVSKYLAKDGYVALYGSCTPLAQITGFGFFQDAFLRMMGFPPYVKSSDIFIKDFKTSQFAKVFSFLKNSDLELFLNIFYPSKKDSFENILKNKMRIFTILEKILKSFLVNNNLIIAIDNFELLDGASYDFIVYMLKNGFFNNRLKLLVSYQDEKDIKSYFELSMEEEKIFETVQTRKFSKEELIETVEKNLGVRLSEIIDKDTIDELIKRADGNAIKMVQEAAFLFDIDYLKLENGNVSVNKTQEKAIIEYNTFEELIKKRVNALPPIVKNVLFMAAIMGYRFSTGILCLAVRMPVEKAEEIMKFLIKNLYIQGVDSYTCEFRSLNLWKLIYKEAKNDLLYKENAQRLYLFLKPLILSSNLQKLISCKAALSINEEFLIWRNTASISAKLGDTNLYVIALKQCLKILEDEKIENCENIKQIIYEEMGKLLCEKSPKEAVTYLANVLDVYIKDVNVKKVIDVSGYFVKSCYLSGNYFGVAEAVDSIINVLKTSNTNISDLELALIKTRKQNALINIGHCEQVINLIEQEILPEIDKNLISNQYDEDYKNIILNAWFNSKLSLAKAYTLQGNNKALDVIEEIEQAIGQNRYNNAYYNLYIGIIKALSKTLSGEVHKSIEILNNVSVVYKTRSMNSGLLILWNLVNIINRVVLNRTKDLKADLFELAAYSNNINEHFIKNIIKLILGYVIKTEDNSEKAQKIYDEQIIYFSKEKAAIGALLAWAFLTVQYMEQGESDKALDTALRSLEIAEGAKINNYLFIVYFRQKLAELYAQKHDYNSAKMYLEKSIIIAKQYNLKYQLANLYISYAKCVQDLMKHSKIHSKENIATVNEMYQNGLMLARELMLQNMVDNISKDYSEFKTYCQLNSIEL